MMRFLRYRKLRKELSRHYLQLFMQWVCMINLKKKVRLFEIISIGRRKLRTQMGLRSPKFHSTISGNLRDEKSPISPMSKTAQNFNNPKFQFWDITKYGFPPMTNLSYYKTFTKCDFFTDNKPIKSKYFLRNPKIKSKESKKSSSKSPH